MSELVSSLNTGIDRHLDTYLYLCQRQDRGAGFRSETREET